MLMQQQQQHRSSIRSLLQAPRKIGNDGSVPLTPLLLLHVILVLCVLIARCCCRLPVELRGALRQQLEEPDVQQDVQCLLQPLQLRAAGHRPGDTPPLPLL